ncbi:MAG TPA: DUF4147 domain-containing protein, partial [Gemmataceae bacterium]|nr:DUF4147 domain-containing protein [Gemmataceae bacterium]
MSGKSTQLRADALAIWKAGVAAARPEELIRNSLADVSLPFFSAIHQAPRIVVVGGGKAGAPMSAAVEETLADVLDRVEGVVNVPAESVRPLNAICLHAARPAGTNQPTAEGVSGSQRILELVSQAGPKDVALCLLSGGGSALLPAPVQGITLEDKLLVTRLLHSCGATINEMNAVRKHLSRIKGGRLAQHFSGQALISLIISDVVGDPLDVIASGPTAPDPTTFKDALDVLKKFDLASRIPKRLTSYLEKGAAGLVEETPKTIPGNVTNLVIGNNTISLAAAKVKAEELGFRVVNLGSFIEGETKEVGIALAGIVRSIQRDGQPGTPPICLLSGGETTVTLSENHGLGGRNQELVLAVGVKLEASGFQNVVVLSGGTDGEDGPTD